MAALKNARHERFYVYELIDPRSGKVFYVGKGVGKRAWEHEKAARRGKERNPFKARILDEIRRAGQSPHVNIVESGLTEEAALRMERGIIVRNHSTLTNIALGNRSPTDVVRAAARENLARMKPLCVLMRERPSAFRLAAWFEIATSFARISRTGEA